MSTELTVDVLDTTGKKADSVELPAEVFGVEPNISLIHQVVVAQQAAARQGTHATKTRSNVRGGSAKPWRQKGTGRARHGSRIAPQWTGGGISHGPQPRSYAKRTNKKMIQAALRGILSDRAAEGRIVVVNQIAGDKPSTKNAAALINAVADYRRVLVVLDRDDANGWMSLRNIQGVHVIAADQLNAYDVVIADAVIFTKAAIDAFVGTETAEAAKAPVEKKTAPKADTAKADDAKASKADEVDAEETQSAAEETEEDDK